MNMWEAIVLIAIVTAIAGVLRSRYYARHGMTDPRETRRALKRGLIHPSELMQPPAPAEPDPELLRELEELRKRVAVLERIATEDRKANAIAEEIESLRDR